MKLSPIKDENIFSWFEAQPYGVEAKTSINEGAGARGLYCRQCKWLGTEFAHEHKVHCLSTCYLITLAFAMHSAQISNQTTVRKTTTGSLQGDKAWSKDPKSALFEILHNKEHFY